MGVRLIQKNVNFVINSCNNNNKQCILNFRIALNKTLNATCNLHGYLFCRMPADTLEVEIKVKTKWGKYSMFQDTYTCTEKYCIWDRADRRRSMQTRRRRTPHREVRSSHDDNTMSETDVPVGQALRYLPQVFTDPGFAATVPQTEEEEEEVSNNVDEERQTGNGHDACATCGETYCWCNSSDWGGLLDIENSNTNPTLEKTPSPTARKPPAGWVEHRRRTVHATKENRRNIQIENSRSNLQEEFNSNNSM